MTRSLSFFLGSHSTADIISAGFKSMAQSYSTGCYIAATHSYFVFKISPFRCHFFAFDSVDGYTPVPQAVFPHRYRPAALWGSQHCSLKD